MTTNLSTKTKRAVSKYGKEICERAYQLNKAGFGGSGAGLELGLTTRQADAAIDAGRELAAQK